MSKRELQHSHHISLQLNIAHKTSPYSALVKSFLETGGWHLLWTKLMLWNWCDCYDEVDICDKLMLVISMCCCNNSDILQTLSNILPLTCVTANEIYEIKTISCKVLFQYKCNLNVFRGVVIICQRESCNIHIIYHYS